MNKQDLRSLIREEIRKVLKEYKDPIEYLEFAVEKVFKENLKLKLEQTIDVRLDNKVNKDFPYIAEVKFTDPTGKYRNKLIQLLNDFNTAAGTLKFPIEADVPTNEKDIFNFGGNGIRLFLRQKK